MGTVWDLLCNWKIYTVKPQLTISEGTLESKW